MSDERTPRRDSGGHITIPPELRPFAAKPGGEAGKAREKSPTAEAILTKLAGEIEDDGDVQVIDPTRGVGNARAYEAAVPIVEAPRGKVVTAKVKINEAKAKSDPPPPGVLIEPDAVIEMTPEGASPWGNAAKVAVNAGDLPSALLPKPVDGGGVVESKRPEQTGETRRGAVALAIGVTVLLGVGVVTVIKMGEVPEKLPGESSRVMAMTGGAMPVVTGEAPSATAVGTTAPSATAPSATAPSAEPSAGAVAPVAPSGTVAPSLPRTNVKEDDPYDASPPPVPAPVKTGSPGVAPPPTVVPTATPVPVPAVTVVPSATPKAVPAPVPTTGRILGSDE